MELAKRYYLDIPALKLFGNPKWVEKFNYVLDKDVRTEIEKIIFEGKMVSTPHHILEVAGVNLRSINKELEKSVLKGNLRLPPKLDDSFDTWLSWIDQIHRRAERFYSNHPMLSVDSIGRGVNSVYRSLNGDSPYTPIIRNKLSEYWQETSTYEKINQWLAYTALERFLEVLVPKNLHEYERVRLKIENYLISGYFDLWKKGINLGAARRILEYLSKKQTFRVMDSAGNTLNLEPLRKYDDGGDLDHCQLLACGWLESKQTQASKVALFSLETHQKQLPRVQSYQTFLGYSKAVSTKYGFLEVPFAFAPGTHYQVAKMSALESGSQELTSTYFGECNYQFNTGEVTWKWDKKNMLRN